MLRLFPPWPLHKAPGGPCVSLWRVCLWSLLCYPTKLLSRYSPHSFIPITCSAVLVQNWHWVINVVLLLSSGQTGGGWCCGKTESFPGFAAILQGELATLLVPFKTGHFVLMFAGFTSQANDAHVMKDCKTVSSSKAVKSISCFLMEIHKEELYIYSKSRFSLYLNSRYYVKIHLNNHAPNFSRPY